MANFNGTNNYQHIKAGKADDLGDIYFRSRMERNVARYLTAIGITDWQYEPTVYLFNNAERGVKAYCPDFYLPTQDIILEVKGYAKSKNGTQILKMRKYHPEEAAKLQAIVSTPTCQAAALYKRKKVPIFVYYRDICKAQDVIPHFES